MQPMRAAIYARVSSAIQREAHSIESQLRALPEYVERQGWILAGRYVDDGRTAKSGHLEKREGFTRAMADAAAGRFDILVVIDLDRLTRSEDLTERGAILGALQRARVQLAIASTGQLLDLSSSMGDLFSGLQTYFAAEWLRKHREKILRGRKMAAERGRKPAGQTPWGLHFDVATGSWSIDEPRAEVVREVFRRVVAGESARALGLELERRGLPAPKGGRWGAGLHRLLRSPVYRGELVVDAGRGHRIAVPAMVDEALWYAAQEALGKASGGIRKGGGQPRHVYLCAGRIWCAVCGQLVQVHSEQMRERVKRGAYYRCSGRRLPKDGLRCTLPMVQVREVDGRVWAAISAFVESPDIIAQLSGRLDGAEEAADWERDAAQAATQLTALEQSEVAILDRHSRGLISDAAMDTHLKRTADRRAFLGRQAASARAAAAIGARVAVSASAALETVQRLRAALAGATAEDRRELVHALVPGWGEHRFVLGADRSVAIGLLINPWLAVTHSGQHETAAHGTIGMSFRLVA